MRSLTFVGCAQTARLAISINLIGQDIQRACSSNLYVLVYKIMRQIGLKNSSLSPLRLTILLNRI